jgi:hypothetical protein
MQPLEPQLKKEGINYDTIERYTTSLADLARFLARWCFIALVNK